MIGNLFKKTTPNDILEQLKNKTFKEEKINSLLQEVDINLRFSDGENFLHKIVTHNNIESVKSLIKHKIDLNAQNLSGDTALHLAAKYNYVDTLSALISANADTTILNTQGRLAIQEAILNNKDDNYMILSQDKKFNINHKDLEGNSLLKDAIKAQNLKIIEDLINKNIEIDSEILFLEDLYLEFNIFTFIIKQFDDINIIDENMVKEVYFTKLGLVDQINVKENTFEFQIRLIENYCSKNNIYNKRLHSPTGMGLGKGKRVETLKNRWENNGILYHPPLDSK